MVIIPFGEYLPDVPAYENPGLVLAKNCIPHSKGYRNFLDAVVYSSALGDVARGFSSSRNNAGVSFSYAGTANKLYYLAAAVWYDATRSSGGDYTTASDDNWEFAKWGDAIVGTNYGDDIQSITYGQSNFAALAGSPPHARHLAVVRDFLVLGNVTDLTPGGAAKPNRLHWSAFDNISLWTPSISTQCDFQDLQGDGGWIQRIIGGEYGTIFQERSIWRMTYIGSPIIFQFDEIEPGYGTVAPQSVCKAGQRIFYLGLDDFYAHVGGVSTPIGTDRVYHTFIDDLDEGYMRNVYGVVHPSLPLAMWAYPGAGAIGGNPNKIIVYNYTVNRWAGPVEINLELFGIFQTEGYTLDQLDAVGDLDSLGYSLDSREWLGKVLNLAGFDTSHRLVTFTGSPLTATFETGDKQLIPGRRAFVTNTRPLIEGVSASVSLAISGRNKLTDAASFDSAVLMNSEGECPVMNENRYQRFRITAADGFDHAQGIEITEVGPGGQY